MKLLDTAGTLIDCVDLSFGFFCRHATLFVVVTSLAVVFISGRYLYRRFIGKPKDQASVIKYLLSNSARHVESAVALRTSNPLLALEKAIYGCVLAQTAKDLADNKTALSKELNVDVYAYLEYTNTVLTQVKNGIKSK